MAFHAFSFVFTFFIDNFYRPIIPIESKDEELIVEDDAELLLERIEEEMAAEEQDSENDEDIFLHVEDLNKVKQNRIYRFSFSFTYVCFVK